MLKSFVLGLALILGAQAQASNCPDHVQVVSSIRIEGSVTLSQDLTDTCKDSVQIANECKQDGMDDYNLRLALAARTQCEYELIRLRKSSVKQSKTFKSTYSRYSNLKYQCRLWTKSEVEKEYCQAESAKLMLTYFKDVK